MKTANCPKCDEHVAIPASASRRALVRCPLCVEEFELSQVLPPTLEVLDDPGEEVADGDSQDVASSRVTKAGPRHDVELKLTDSDAVAVCDSESGVGVPIMSSKHCARPQRPQNNAFKTIIKVVSGGVVGLAIGQLIVWWLPGEWKRDPLELGPRISRIPWVGPRIVPIRYHHDSRAQEGATSAKPLRAEELDRFAFPAPSLGGGGAPEDSSSKTANKKNEWANNRDDIPLLGVGSESSIEK